MEAHEGNSKSVHCKTDYIFRENARQEMFIDKFGSVKWNVVHIYVTDLGKCYWLDGLEF